jgi:GWxTD domain-containing protein
MSSYRAPAAALELLIFTVAVFAQSTGNLKPPGFGQEQVTGKPDQSDPLKRPLKKKKASEQAFHHEVEGPYQKWLTEDVRYIITPEENDAFLLLPSDQRRDEFIAAFWDRRNPIPGAAENRYKEEHYRRLAYANTHFAANVPGWRTDRGHIYIQYGPPDEIEAHPSGTHERPIEEGGGTTSVYPFEEWRYRHINGFGDNVVIEFVDTCKCGDYKMVVDRNR